MDISSAKLQRPSKKFAHCSCPDPSLSLPSVALLVLSCPLQYDTVLLRLFPAHLLARDFLRLDPSSV